MSSRARKKRAGSATAEGAIVAVFLAMLFGAAIWVAKLFEHSLIIGSQVRAQVDGPSYRGSSDGRPDTERLDLFSPGASLADQWVPLRASERDTMKIDTVWGSSSARVERTAPVGSGGADLRWEDGRERNE